MEIKALIADSRLSGQPLSGNIEDYPDGIIIPVDKPYRWTSADVVRKLKRAACRHFGKRNLKVGHAGTLDPLATGVLLVCVGKATRLAESLQKEGKEYLAGISFGATTPSYDLEKAVDRLYPVDGVSEEALRRVLPSFLGEQEQIAPLFSAKSVDGVRAYELARRQYREARKAKTDVMEDFDHTVAETLHRQMITIYGIELMDFSRSLSSVEGLIPAEEDGGSTSSPTAEGRPLSAAEGPNGRINVADTSSLNLPKALIRVACGKGTYIRALARDIGEALNSGAHLHSLCRTKSGGFTVETALSVTEAVALFSTETQE